MAWADEVPISTRPDCEMRKMGQVSFFDSRTISQAFTDMGLAPNDVREASQKYKDDLHN